MNRAKQCDITNMIVLCLIMVADVSKKGLGFQMIIKHQTRYLVALLKRLVRTKKASPDVVQCITCNKALLICDSTSLVGSMFRPQSDTCIQNRHVLFM